MCRIIILFEIVITIILLKGVFLYEQDSEFVCSKIAFSSANFKSIEGGKF